MNDLSKALVSYFEFGSSAWPQSNEEALTALSADDRVQIEEILAFAGNCQPEFDDLATGASLVRANIHDRYPFLPDEALDALAWAWSYWSK